MKQSNLLQANNQLLVLVACLELVPTYGKKKACPSLTYKDFNCLGSLGGGWGEVPWDETQNVPTESGRQKQYRKHVRNTKRMCQERHILMDLSVGTVAVTI
jgi:hypothetical protein